MEEEKTTNNKNLTVVGIILSLLLAGGAVYYFKNYSTSTPQTAGPTIEETKDIPQEKPQPTTVWDIIKPITADDHILGSPEAKLTIVVYSDIECVYCKKFHSTMEQIIEEYGKNGSVRWIYRHFPLKQSHPTAPKEAEATECAAELGGNAKFWEYMNKLNNNFTPSQTNLTNQLTDIAGELGLDKNEFKACLESGRHAPKIARNGQEAVNLGAKGTPFSIIIDPEGKIAPIPGALPYEQLKEVIELVLKSFENQ